MGLSPELSATTEVIVPFLGLAKCQFAHRGNERSNIDIELMR